MLKITISAETEVCDSRDADPDDPWDQGDTEGRVTNVIAFVARDTVGRSGESLTKELDVRLGGIVYAVVADYSSGDTFGRSGGHAQILGVFTAPEEAAGLLKAAQAVSQSGDFSARYGFTYNGRKYHRAWVGYFESLQSLDVWDVRVRPNPADPFRPKGTGRYSHKRMGTGS